jgi:hypothetical protein
MVVVEFARFFAVGGEELGARIVGLHWFKELSEGGMEAVL